MNQSFDDVIEIIKRECDSSNGRCDKCKLYSICENINDFPYEIIKAIKIALCEN